MKIGDIFRLRPIYKEMALTELPKHLRIIGLLAHHSTPTDPYCAIEILDNEYSPRARLPESSIRAFYFQEVLKYNEIWNKINEN